MQRWKESFSLMSRLSVNASKSARRGNGGNAGVRVYSSGISETEVLNARSREPRSQLFRRGGALAVFVATGLVGYSAFDDLIVYDRCSSKAMETAAQDPRLKAVIGGRIQRASWHWYNASVAVARKGDSASCSFPVSGSDGTGSLHLKAIRRNGKGNRFLPRMMDGGQWDIVMLDAQIPSVNPENSPPKIQTINLIRLSAELKPADGVAGAGGHSISAALQKV